MKLEKITTKTKRRYEDSCGTAHALDLVGERWALLVMRELMLGPRRFSDLRANLPGVSANVLTQRLESLEGSGVLRRRKLPPPASVQVYELTEWGLEAEPIILSLGRWGARSPLQDDSLPISAMSAILSMRAMFDPARTEEKLDMTLAFHFDQDAYTVNVREGRLTAERGEADEVDVEIRGSPSDVLGVVYGLSSLEEAERAGMLTVTGDRAGFLRFASAFELPPKACA
ncbi:winged helix-turn-helix transcriptional regulator [Chelativorans sp. YIM 93263]|uniref:winged helix-turn-helix transcriptional regulator n=1 Tax=Chelativorans sp. YIM 93263 TaxID=2906648 RepID=UPI00237A0639|nr:helix-turn-helix domain-containing protein [Chelativorans sp. YIM 93263]